MTNDINVSPTGTRLHARGPRGEACIIVRITGPSDAQGGVEVRYRLATGEHLKSGAEPMEFVTLDGKRAFKVY